MPKTRIERIQEAKKFIFAESMDDPSTICTFDLYKIDGDWIFGKLPGTVRREGFLLAYALPIEALPQLTDICLKRQALKKEYDASMALIYELLNQITRGEV
jgi:hypothetical protein